jgi:hypothetical protein
MARNRIVGLDARGFLFGPSLALRLGASFAPVRKRGKLPGPTVESAFEKEYGQDYFQMQADAVKPGQTVLVVDDIIATGKYRLQSVTWTPRWALSNFFLQQVDQLLPLVNSSKNWVENWSDTSSFSNSTFSKVAISSPHQSSLSSAMKWWVRIDNTFYCWVAPFFRDSIGVAGSEHST